MRIIQAPEPIKRQDGEFLIFLSGSTGDHDWRTELVEPLMERQSKASVIFINPFRSPWPKTVKDLQAQFEWETTGLMQADSIIFWFGNETVAPLTLLEMGLSLDGNKPIFIGMNPNYKLSFDVSERIKLFRPSITIWPTVDALRTQVSKYIKPFNTSMSGLTARRVRK